MQTSATQGGGPGFEDTVTRVYRLRPGDRLKVTVFQEAELSGEYEVSVHGRVALPLIGEVAATGFSIQEFKEAVTARLADGYLRQPRVSVEVLNYRPFYVHGEVRGAGEFKYQPGISFRDAIAMAGGSTYRADESYIILVRHGDGREIKVPLPSQYLVLPGDNIRIPERFF
ncbi:MAG: polysaccharide export protein [Rhizobiales bacterium]|nr:polysaccharide export protein [Hyphomicrobiales bacterium]